jgi:hypothetical protein
MSNDLATEENQKVVSAYGWAASDASGILSPFHFTRRYIYIYIFKLHVLN